MERFKGRKFFARERTPSFQNSEFVPLNIAAYTENSSDAFRRLRRRGRQAPQNLI